MTEHPLDIDLLDYVEVIQGHAEPTTSARLWQLDIPQHLMDCGLCRKKVFRLIEAGEDEEDE